MKTIFKNAYFGKPYKSRDGRKVLYHSYNNIYPDNPYKHHHNLILEKPHDDSLWIYCNDYGHTEEHINGEWLNVAASDIVSEWEEQISEEVDDERLTIAESKELMHDVVELKTKLLDSKKEIINKACEIFKDALVSLARENRIDCDTIGKNMKIFKEAMEE